MHLQSFVFVALGSLGAAAAQSHVPSSSSGNDTNDPARTVAVAPTAVAEAGIVTDRAADGVLWAAGPSWKARFDPAGTTFVPCFGPEAPHNFPARLDRATVRVAGQTLVAGGEVPVFDAGRAEFRGSAFTERYVLQDAGIEQQFVFDTLPKRGELEVWVPFASELAVVSAADGGFRVAGSHGSFEYGRAVAIDAAGRRAELTTEWQGAGFTIRVPAAFVAEAELPLLVDPLLGNVTTFTADTRVLTATDLAWDESMGRYALVWERVFSATDSDVYLRYLDGAMQAVGGAVAIDLSLDSWRRPHVAGLEAHDTFLVVAERSVGNVAPFSAYGRQILGATPTVQVPVLLGGSGDVRHPDVGGDASPIGPSRFCIVFEMEFSPTDHDVHYEVRDANLNFVASNYVDGSSTYETAPRVGKSCGAPGGGTEGWGIAYLRPIGNGQNQPMFACLGRNLSFSVSHRAWPIQVPAANGSVAVSSPTDHAQGRRYLTYAQYDGSNSEYARGYVFDRNGVQVAATGVFGSGTPVEGEACVESDGTRFVIANHHRSPGSANPWASVNLYGIAGQVLSYEESAGLGLTAMAPSVVARRSGGGGDRTYGLAWVQPQSATTGRLACANYDGVQGGAQFGVRFTSCGGLGFLSGGETVLGGTVSLQLASSVGLLGWVVGLPVDVPLGLCPGCRQGVDGSVVLGAAYQFAVPRNAAFVGFTLAFQGFQFLPTSGSGACLGQINLSNTLDATIR